LEVLADADLFVLPSHQENFGIAVVEALAAGCPVLVSNHVNIHSEISAAGVGGVIATRIDSLAAALTKWMGEPELRSAAAGKARPYVRDNYDWRAIASRWAQRYAKMRETQRNAVRDAVPAVLERT
jgi:glycosyltransferase involved in cell wall biosynthesis